MFRLGSKKHQAAEAQAVQTESQKKAVKKRYSVKIYRIIFLVVLLVLIAAAFFYYLAYNKEPGWLGEVRKTQSTVDFPIYYPDDLSEKFTYQGPPIVIGEGENKNAVSYRFKYDNNQELSILSQKRFKTKPFEIYYQRTVANGQDVSSTAGDAKILNRNGNLSGSLLTDTTWVMVSAPKLDKDTLVQILGSLKTIR